MIQHRLELSVMGPISWPMPFSGPLWVDKGALGDDGSHNAYCVLVFGQCKSRRCWVKPDLRPQISQNGRSASQTREKLIMQRHDKKPNNLKKRAVVVEEQQVKRMYIYDSRKVGRSDEYMTVVRRKDYLLSNYTET